MKWISTLFIIVFTVAVYAACPHCFDIVRVEAVYTDGTRDTVWFERYPDQMPLLEAGDGQRIIDLENNPYRRESPEYLRLIDTVYRLEDMTMATAPENIDSVAFDKIERLVYLDNTGFSAAGRINTFSTEKIKMLQKTPLDTITLNYDLGQLIFANYNDSIGDSTFKYVALLCSRHFPDRKFTSGQFPDPDVIDSEGRQIWLEKARNWNDSNLTFWTKIDTAVGQLQQFDTADYYISEIQDSIEPVINFHLAYKDYFENRDASTFSARLMLIFDKFGYDRLPLKDPVTGEPPENAFRLKILARKFYDNFFAPAPDWRTFPGKFDILTVYNAAD